jgi:hypothetical protein
MAFETTIYKVITNIKDIPCIMKVIRVSWNEGMFPIRADSVVVSVYDTAVKIYAEKAELAQNQQVIYGYFATDALSPFVDATIDCQMGNTVLARIPVTNLQNLVEPELFAAPSIPDATLAWLETI